MSENFAASAGLSWILSAFRNQIIDLVDDPALAAADIARPCSQPRVANASAPEPLLGLCAVEGFVAVGETRGRVVTL